MNSSLLEQQYRKQHILTREPVVFKASDYHPKERNGVQQVNTTSYQRHQRMKWNEDRGTIDNHKEDSVE